MSGEDVPRILGRIWQIFTRYSRKMKAFAYQRLHQSGTLEKKKKKKEKKAKARQMGQKK